MPVSIEDGEAVPIAVAAKLFFPHGGVTVYTLRSAIRRGELQCEVIGRGYCVTPADIRKWRELCRKAAAHKVTNATTGAHTGSTADDRRAVARMALESLLSEDVPKRKK